MSSLLIIGHGSTLNPDSSAPTHEHADAIRSRGLFDEVACAFWKEDPSMREIFYQMRGSEIFVVPNFISEGYFCQQVIPRELQLDGPITQKNGRVFYYCDPVGIHPSMTKLLLKRADEVAPGIPRSESCLIIVGHGTTLNDNSRKAIQDQVNLIREGGYGFAEVLDAYMEEPPLVAKWDTLASAPNVIVVPFFIADGLHSYQDIPVLLGIESEPTAAASQNSVFRSNPHQLRDKTLFYSSAIGTEELMAEVILDQVNDFKTKHQDAIAQITPTWTPPPPAIPEGVWNIGQIHVSPDGAGGYLLSHCDDAASETNSSLERLSEPAAIRQLTLYTESGEFRPIKTAPNLKTGWLIQARDADELRLILDFIYPSALGLWEHHLAGVLNPIPLRETLSRQTGMYRYSNNITDEQAEQLATEQAALSLRKIAWPLSQEKELLSLPAEKCFKIPTPDNHLPLIAVEADTHVVSAAREVSRANFQAARE